MPTDAAARRGARPARGLKLLWRHATWALGFWLAGRRRAAERPDDARRLDYRAQLRGMNVRMSEALRDRLRPRWLRLRRTDDDPRATSRSHGG